MNQKYVNSTNLCLYGIMSGNIKVKKVIQVVLERKEPKEINIQKIQRNFYNQAHYTEFYVNGESTFREKCQCFFQIELEDGRIFQSGVCITVSKTRKDLEIESELLIE